MSSPKSHPSTSGRVSPISGGKKKENENIWGFIGAILLALVGFGIIGVFIYNFIVSVIAVISISQDEVESVCPNSQLWWFALFVGVIWPIMGSKGAHGQASSEEPFTFEMGLCLAITYFGLFTTFIFWAWDQLWGVPGFANDTCAMEHWEIYNSTEGANNDGHKLFTVVEWWMYIFMIIDGIIVFAFCGFGGVIVIDGYQSRKKEVEQKNKKNLSDVLTGSHPSQHSSGSVNPTSQVVADENVVQALPGALYGSNSENVV